MSLKSRLSPIFAPPSRLLALVVGISAIVLAPTHASAAPFDLGNITSQGKACPAGTFSVTIAPDGSVMSILFDAFNSQVGGATKIPRTDQTCDLRIPVALPPHSRLVLQTADIRGFASLPVNTHIRIKSGHGLVSSDGSGDEGSIENDHRVEGPYEGDLFFQVPVKRGGKSKCGAIDIIKMHLEIALDASWSKGSKQFIAPDTALMSVDSADLHQDPSVQYHFALQGC